MASEYPLSSSRSVPALVTWTIHTPELLHTCPCDLPGEIWSRRNGWTATTEVVHMPKKRCTPEEIIQHLRTGNVQTGKMADGARRLSKR